MALLIVENLRYLFQLVRRTLDAQVLEGLVKIGGIADVQADTEPDFALGAPTTDAAYRVVLHV